MVSQVREDILYGDIYEFYEKSLSVVSKIWLLLNFEMVSDTRT